MPEQRTFNLTLEIASGLALITPWFSLLLLRMRLMGAPFRWRLLYKRLHYPLTCWRFARIPHRS